jgi:hypothetical protein
VVFSRLKQDSAGKLSFVKVCHFKGVQYSQNELNTTIPVNCTKNAAYCYGNIHHTYSQKMTSVICGSIKVHYIGLALHMTRKVWLAPCTQTQFSLKSSAITEMWGNESRLFGTI